MAGLQKNLLEESLKVGHAKTIVFTLNRYTVKNSILCCWVVFYFANGLFGQMEYSSKDTLQANLCLEEAQILLNAGQYDSALQKLRIPSIVYNFLSLTESEHYGNKNRIFNCVWTIYLEEKCLFKKRQVDSQNIFFQNKFEKAFAVFEADNQNLVSFCCQLALAYEDLGEFFHADILHAVGIHIAGVDNDLNLKKILTKGKVYETIENFRYDSTELDISQWYKFDTIQATNLLNYLADAQLRVSGNCSSIMVSPYYTRLAYDWVKGKALTLNESIPQISWRRSGILPDSLRRLEFDLRSQINLGELKLSELKHQGYKDTHPAVVMLNTELLERKKIYYRTISAWGVSIEQNQSSIEDQNNDYNIDNYEVQNDGLSQDQSIVEYFISDRYIFVFVIEGANFRLAAIKKDFPLEEWVQRLRYGIYGYYREVEQNDTLADFAAREYVEAACLLYNKLHTTGHFCKTHDFSGKGC